MMGGILAAAGDFFGAQSTNRAGRKARDWYDKRTGEGTQRLGNLVYGPEGAQSVDPLYQQMQGLIPRVGHGQAGILGQFDQQTGQLNAAAGQALQASNLAGQQGDYYARQFGRGAEDLIDQQTQAAIANRTAMAQGANRAGGFQSTASNQGIAGVAAPLLRNALGAKVGVRGQQAQMRQANNQATAARGANLSNAQLGRGHQRAGMRTQMQQGNLQRDIAMRQAPMNLALGVQQGSVMNPWLGQNTSQYYPGASPLGASLQTGGETLAGLEGIALGRGGSLMSAYGLG